MTDIVLTASNSAIESYRLDRLQRVVGYVCSLGSVAGNLDVLSKIIRLQDHNDHLTALWNVMPTRSEMSFVRLAWESEIGAGSDNVAHEVASSGGHPQGGSPNRSVVQFNPLERRDVIRGRS